MFILNPITLILSGYLLATLLMLAFVGFSSHIAPQNLSRRWLQFLLAASGGLALLMAGLMLLARNGAGTFSQSVLIVLPGLGGLLVILLTQGRAFYDLRKTHRLALIGLAATLLFQAIILAIGDSATLLALLAACGLAAVIWLVGIRAGDIPLIIAGLLASAWLPLGATTFIIEGIRNGPPILRTVFAATNLLSTLLVILVPALLIYMQLQGRPTSEKWIFQLRLIMSFLFVSAGLLSAANQAVEATYSIGQIENYYPFLQFYAAVLAGSLLMSHMDEHLRVVGLIYAIGIIFASAAAFSLGWRMTAGSIINLMEVKNYAPQMVSHVPVLAGSLGSICMVAAAPTQLRRKRRNYRDRGAQPGRRTRCSKRCGEKRSKSSAI